MKTCLVLLLTLLSVTAVAEHHRGHALMNLAESVRLLNKAQNNAAALKVCPQYSTFQLRSLDGVPRYLNETQKVLEAARLAILDGRLDDARFQLMQPVEQRFLEDGTPASSASRWLLSAGANYKWLVDDACTGNEYNLSSIIYNVAKAWFFVDLANWHVQDAIREEIYHDPVFICAGPNNHCE